MGIAHPVIDNAIVLEPLSINPFPSIFPICQCQKLNNISQIWNNLLNTYKFYPIDPQNKGEEAFCYGFQALDEGNIERAYQYFIVALSEDPSSLRKQIFVFFCPFYFSN